MTVPGTGTGRRPATQSPAPEDVLDLDHARVLAALPCPVAVTDLGGGLVEANAQFAALGEGAARGLPAATASARQRRAQSGAGEVVDDGVLPVGPARLLACRVGLVLREDGSPGWYVVRVQTGDDLSARDGLTGLGDRRALLQRLELSLARRARTGSLVELVVVDLDGFKAVNDAHGHVSGDVVLRQVAARLVGVVRPTDLVCRWGGDEFVVLLEDPSEVGGAEVARRLEAALAVPVDLPGGARVVVRASCGWVRADDDEPGEHVLQRADAEMYAVKRTRRGPRLLQGLRRALGRPAAPAADAGGTASVGP